MKNIWIRSSAALIAALVCLILSASAGVSAQSAPVRRTMNGGGYAVSGQLSGMGYSTAIYDSSNGLVTSDAMYILSAADGRLWIGGYSGVMCYDGSYFERLDTSEGLTSARGMFEDSKGRIWVGTNDNGVVVVNGRDQRHITYKDGLPSSSIRIFEEDAHGNVFIGTTSGLCYADPDLKVHELTGEALSEERIMKLSSAIDGRIYGQTTNGVIFAVDDCSVTQLFTTADIGSSRITTILADPKKAEKVYLGTEDGTILYGTFGDKAEQMTAVEVPETFGPIHWLSYDCGRVWASSVSAVGYIDEYDHFRVVEDIPMDSGIEMTTSDYQGNLWIASSTQGIMKLVTNNFIDVNRKYGLKGEVANAACMYNGDLYIGTNDGLRIINQSGRLLENKLTEYIGDSRVRYIVRDREGGLWIANYSNGLGLVRYTRSGDITSFTTADGMPDDQVRCIDIAEDGSIIAGTYNGLAVIKDGKVVRTAVYEDGIENTVLLCVSEGDNGTVLAGSDGGGMYVIDDNKVTKIGRDDGLTSDVIMKIKRDKKRGVYWLVTSNSIEYMKDGVIVPVTSFPNTNNYDIYFDDHNNAWVLSSNGIYTVDVDEMLSDKVTKYELYTAANGVPFPATSNSVSDLEVDGELYIPGRNGVIQVNINNFFRINEEFYMDIRAVYCDDQRIYPDSRGVFIVPASKGRVQISASVIDYGMFDPTVRIFLENGPDDGMTVQKKDLSALEYTNLPHGDYSLRLQVIDRNTGGVVQERSFRFIKESRLLERRVIQMIVVALVIFSVGFFVWWLLRSTIIARQYVEIYKAKEEAEKANTTKSKFLAKISHEILTPINTIVGMNEMTLREDAADVPKNYLTNVRGYALDIRNASESLMYLMNDLLDLSGLESGEASLFLSEYDTTEVLESMISMTRKRCDDKGIDFIVDVEEIIPVRLKGDIDKIRQIILNLLTNSVKYTFVGSVSFKVSMEAKIGDECILRFSVKDTGGGIHDKARENMFVVYDKIPELDESEEMSTGLSLDISRKYADLMDAELTYESEQGKGTEFVFTLRQKIIDPRPVGTFAEHIEGINTEKYVPLFVAPDADVLIISNDEMTIKVIRGLLKATEVFVTTVSDTEACMDILRDTKINVVLFDYMLYSKENDDTKKLRKYDPELPVYAITSNVSTDDEVYRAGGFNGRITKPISSTVLEKTVMRHLSDEMMEKQEELYLRR